MKKFLAVAFIFLAVVTVARADFYIKSKTHSDAYAMMGQSQPAKDDFQEVWFGTDKFASITPDMSLILDLGKGMAWMVDHKHKTYVETTLPLDMAKLLPPQMASMMGMMKSTVEVQPTTETKAIGQWPCTLYNVSINMMMMPMKFQVWASEKVPFNLKFFQEKMFPNLMKGTLRLDDAAIAEMGKVKGYWIASEMNMDVMGAKMHNTTEVVEMSQKTPGAGVYGIPTGYTKSQYLTMGR